MKQWTDIREWIAEEDRLIAAGYDSITVYTGEEGEGKSLTMLARQKLADANFHQPGSWSKSWKPELPTDRVMFEEEDAMRHAQRADLSPYEEARAYKQALDANKKLTVADLARMAGRPHNHVKGRLQLMDLPEELGKQVSLGRGGFSMAHVKLLQPVAKDPKALKVALEAIRDYQPTPIDDKLEWAPVEDAADLVADALVEAGLAVDAKAAAGLKPTGIYDSGVATRVEKAAKKVGGFELGDYQGRLLVPATPAAKSAIREIRVAESEKKSEKRQAEQKAKAKRDQEHERDALVRAGAKVLQREAIIKASIDVKDLLPFVEADVFANYRCTRQLFAEILAGFGVEVPPGGYVVMDPGEAGVILDRMAPADHTAAVVALSLAVKVQNDEAPWLVKQVLGRDEQDFLKAARDEIKAAKKAKKNEPDPVVVEAASRAEAVQTELVSTGLADTTCPQCGKHVQTLPNGKLRPHQVPIEKRKDPKVSERCVLQVQDQAAKPDDEAPAGGDLEAPQEA